MIESEMGKASQGLANKDSLSPIQRNSPLLSIFAIPKPFVGRDDLIQRNAIGSWLRSTTAEEIVLFGGADGAASVAAELGVTHVVQLAQNECGTPLVNDAFAEAANHLRGQFLVYANSDIIFQGDLSMVASRLRRCTA